MIDFQQENATKNKTNLLFKVALNEQSINFVNSTDALIPLIKKRNLHSRETLAQLLSCSLPDLRAAAILTIEVADIQLTDMQVEQISQEISELTNLNGLSFKFSRNCIAESGLASLFSKGLSNLYDLSSLELDLQFNSL